MIRLPEDEAAEHVERRLRREVTIWQGLKHKNVLPFFGLSEDVAPRPVLISLLCEFGHIATYLKTHPWANRAELVRVSESAFRVDSMLSHRCTA
jgi:hypothetical protein